MTIKKCKRRTAVKPSYPTSLGSESGFNTLAGALSESDRSLVYMADDDLSDGVTVT